MKKTLTAVSLLAVLTATGCSSQDGKDLGLSLEEKAGVTAISSFQQMEGTPEGWTSTLTTAIPENEKAEAEAYFKLHPVTLQNADKTCTYSQESASMPSYMANRDEEYLSKAYIYQQSEGNGTVPGSSIQSVGVNTSAGKMEFAYSTFNPKVNDLKNNTDKNADPTKVNTVQKYRAVAVRIFESPVDQKLKASENAPAPFGSDASKVLPGVILTYECNTQESFKEDDAKALFNASRIELKK
jgi:hypothetical protein